MCNNKLNFLVKFFYIKDMHYYRIPHYLSHIDYYKKIDPNKYKIIGGSLFPYNGSTLFIEANNKNDITELIENDPFYKNKLVVTYSVEPFELITSTPISELTKSFSFITK